MDFSIEDIDKALEELSILRNADAVRGVGFGESYKDTLDMSSKALIYIKSLLNHKEES